MYITVKKLQFEILVFFVRNLAKYTSKIQKVGTKWAIIYLCQSSIPSTYILQIFPMNITFSNVDVSKNTIKVFKNNSNFNTTLNKFLVKNNSSSYEALWRNWITRLTTDQKIAGSSPAKIDNCISFFCTFLLFLLIYC